MKLLRSITLAITLTSTSLSSAVEMNGIFYCLSEAAAGIDNGTSSTYKPSEKFTVKVDKNSGWMTLTGGVDDMFEITGINNSNAFANADGGVFKGLVLQGNSQGSFDFVLRNSYVDPSSLKEIAVYLETGKCQKW